MVGRNIVHMGIPIQDEGDGQRPGGRRNPWRKWFGEGGCSKKETRVKGKNKYIRMIKNNQGWRLRLH